MKVSVAIVTFNSESVIEDCLRSLLLQRYKNFEILIYDNSSGDDTCGMIERLNIPFLRLVKGRFNRGFGFGLNRLVEIAGGEIIASLNPDTKVDENWIGEAIRHFEDKQVGMVSSRVVFKGSPDLLDSAGHLLYPDGLNRGRGHNKRFSQEFANVEEVAFPSGSAGFYRKDIYLKLGGVDESLFLFGDDTDIGLKFQLSGYKCIYEPNSIVFHEYSHSTGKYSDLKAYFVERNRIKILLKYFPEDLIVKSLYYTLKRVLYHNLSALIDKGSTARYLKSGSIIRLYTLMFRAYVDALLDLPLIMKERREIKKRVNSNLIRELLKRHSISAREIALTD